MSHPRDAPRRPSIPPIAWFVCATWVGCVCAERVSWALYGDAFVWWRLASVLAAAGGLGVAGWRWPILRGPVALVLAGLLAGACASGMQAAEWHRQSATVGDCGAREWTGVVESDPVPGRFGATVRVRLAGGPLDGARVRVYWPPEEPMPDLGRMVRFSAVLEPVPADEPWARRVARTGAVALGTAWRAETGAWRPGIVGRLFAWRARVLSRMHGVGGAGGDLLEGIVLGDRRRLSGTEADEDFRVLGLTHLVAVSGSHLALACGAVAALGAMAGVRRRPLAVMTVVAGAAYAAVTGMAYAALRSLMMLGVASVGVLSGRRGDGVASLASGVLAVLVIEPWAVYDIGFQLSVLAVGSLLLFGGLATAWAEAGVPRWGRLAAGPVALTFVAQAVTVPVVATAFGMVSLLAPLANAYAGPMVSAALWTGLAGAVTIEAAPGPGDWLLRSSGAILEATAHIAGWMAAIPGAAVSLGAGALVTIGPVLAAAVIWIRWPLPGSRGAAKALIWAALLMTGAVALGPGASHGASLTVLDVGQGDAILLRDGKRTMLVDAGPDDVSLRRALARHGIRRIDVLVLTHAHDDHIGGAAGLEQVAEIGWTGYPAVDPAGFQWLREATGGTAGYGEPRALCAGDRFKLGSTVVTVLWPPEECPEGLGSNDTSVILRLERGGFDALLAGDAERVALEGAAAGEGLEPVEVLKVPHHGSDNGLAAEALESLSPRDALISVGEGNDFGHPCASTLDMLTASDVRIWRTDRSGDLLVRIGRTGYSVEASRHSTRVSLRARMNVPSRQVAADARNRYPPPEATHGSQRAGGPETGLSHLWRRGAAARTRAPPASGPDRRGGGPHVQLRVLRRGVRGSG